MTTTIVTIELGELGLTGLRLKTDKLNKRAERHGMNKLVVTITREWTERDEDTGLDVKRYSVDVSGSAPCINGWGLLARIEFNELIGTVVRAVPTDGDDPDLSEYREHDGSCDHCNTNRRRNDVFVLVDRDGNRKVVGRNCCADFVRSGDADDFARWAAYLDECGSWTVAGCEDEGYGEGGYGRGGSAVMQLETLLTAAVTCTRRIGWTSRTAARELDGVMATADCAVRLAYGRRDTYWKDWVNHYDLTDCAKDADKARAAIEWAKSVDSSKSEYLEVLRKIATTGLCDYGLAGYAASMVRAYDKDREWAADRAEKAAGAKEKVYAGDVGKTRDIGVVTIKGIHTFEGNYGVTTIVRMVMAVSDTQEAPIVWFASGERDYDEGDTYQLRAGIKACNDDPKYGKQTVVTRAKLVLIESVTPDDVGCPACTEDRECPDCEAPAVRAW